MMDVWILSGALLLDVLFREPPNALHPVAWMGTLIGKVRDWCPSKRCGVELAWGALMALGIPSALALMSYLLLAELAKWPIISLICATLLLKSMFALRALGEAAMNVRRALLAARIQEARAGLGSLCSRDASQLTEPELVAATVESVAENASDSFVAPIFYFALFGVPGAVFYRAVNTLDAMIGYRGRFEYLGKFSARLDDVLNYIPARITAFALLIAGSFMRMDVRSGLRVLLRDARRTESPNAGRPMATMAGLLRVQLTKPGHYTLGDNQVALNITAIDRAWRAVQLAGALTWCAVCALLWVRHG
jgi:adenosylcobinamide-phosphate synthase